MAIPASKLKHIRKHPVRVAGSQGQPPSCLTTQAEKDQFARAEEALKVHGPIPVEDVIASLAK